MNANSTTPGEFGFANERVFLALSFVGLTWYLAIWALGLLGCSAARRRYRNRPRSPLASAPANAVPGVSILRPLKGLDSNLYENLESTFTQEYPNFEIIFSVASENDQALGIVRDLLSKYPSVNARIIIGEEVVGINPKVNNLVRSYREAAHDILWVIDSNVIASPGSLARSVDILAGPSPTLDTEFSRARRIGLVHHVPYAYTNEPTLGSILERTFLNTNHAKMYVAINTVALDSCVVGKSNLYRRSDVDRLDGSLRPHPASGGGRPPGDRGLAAFGRFLAEDNMIAGALWHELGLGHDLSCDVARNDIGRMSLADYVWRRVRWIRVRKRMVLAATVFEPFTECVALAVIGAASLNALFGIPAWFAIAAHLAVWIPVDMDVCASLAGYPIPPSKKAEFLCGWIAREALALPIYLLAIFGDEVQWRGQTYRVKRGGEVYVVDENEERSGAWCAKFWRGTGGGYEVLNEEEGQRR